MNPNRRIPEEGYQLLKVITKNFLIRKSETNEFSDQMQLHQRWLERGQRGRRKRRCKKPEQVTKRLVQKGARWMNNDYPEYENRGEGLLGPMLDIPSKYSNQPWKIIFNWFHTLEKILESVFLRYKEEGVDDGKWILTESPVQCNVNSVEVSGFPNEEPGCQRIMIQELWTLLCCLLEEINVYEQSVNHRR